MDSPNNTETPSILQPPEEKAMPLWEHLEELRSVLIKSLIALLVGFGVTYRYSESLIHFLEAPLLSVLPAGEKNLYFMGITDKFFVYLKVSFYASLVVTSPYVLKQVWSFVSPGLKEDERRYGIPFLMMATFSFWLGLAFAYYIVIPSGYRFLIHFGGPSEKPMINISDYFSLTLQLLFCMGIIFELPVVLMILGKVGIIKSEWLTRFRPHSYVVLAVVAAFLTPTPDAFTMLLVLAPLILLFEFSIQLVRWIVKTPSDFASIHV